jgi:hypothetical protein
MITIVAGLVNIGLNLWLNSYLWDYDSHLYNNIYHFF